MPVIHTRLLALSLCVALSCLASPCLAQAKKPIEQAHFALSDAGEFSKCDEASSSETTEYPSYVSTDAGFPRKPLWERPGDVNQSQNMSPRYCQDDGFRAGWPLEVRKRAICSINSRYSVGFVGGGSSLLFPFGRTRMAEEGTWGLDYSLWSKPRTVWTRWTNGRHQGGEGAYETDN